MAELADAPHSKCGGVIRESSNLSANIMWKHRKETKNIMKYESEDKEMNETRLPFDCVAVMGERVADSDAVPNHVFLGGTIPARPKSMTDLFRNITPETKTKLVSVDGRLIAGVYDKGVIVRTANIIPDIVDVKVIKENDEPKVIKVTFADNSVEKAVLDKNDTYSLEQGISICITKRILSADAGVGNSIYNKLISRAIDVMESNEKEAEKREKELADEKAKMEKIAAKKKQRAEQRAAKQREDYINAHAEAYVRAMKKIREEDKTELDKALDKATEGFEKFLNSLLEQCEEEMQLEKKVSGEIATDENKTVTEMNESQE